MGKAILIHSNCKNTVASDLPLLNYIQFISKLTHWRITVDFFMFSFSAGLFVVPLYTYLQISCDDTMRARTIAANNICNALSMVFGSILVMVMLKLNLGIALVFLVMAISNAIASVALWALLFFSKEFDNSAATLS